MLAQTLYLAFVSAFVGVVIVGHVLVLAAVLRVRLQDHSAPRFVAGPTTGENEAVAPLAADFPSRKLAA
jgi:hypothetical protein